MPDSSRFIANGATTAAAHTRLTSIITMCPVTTSSRIRMPITFSFLPFCTRVSVHTRRIRGWHIRYVFSTYAEVRYGAHATFSVDLYGIFFSNPIRSSMYNSNLGSFLSRIIGYTLFCAYLLRYGEQWHAVDLGFFPHRKKEKEFCRRFRNFIAHSTSNLLDKRERYEVINFSSAPRFRIPFRSTWNK